MAREHVRQNETALQERPATSSRPVGFGGMCWPPKPNLMHLPKFMQIMQILGEKILSGEKILALAQKRM